MDVISYSELNDEKLRELISKRRSFTLTDVDGISRTVTRLESHIEGQGLSCRIYTAGRKAVMASTFSPAALFGLASSAAIAAHNLATRNPDYEVAKYPLTNKLEITFMK
ncbi:hypothetical protein [Vibrio sp. TBV020]|uniref:hypothetical protein n=1 Tax=Vibrio sp. TBV020 TaxID=3137398 RepID=UPI0038CDC91E